MPEKYTILGGTELHRLRPDGSTYEFLGYINRADANGIASVLNKGEHVPDSYYPPKYGTIPAPLDEIIDLIVDQIMMIVDLGKDGRCKSLRDFYMLEGALIALASILSTDERPAHQVVLERFAEAARSPEEEAAIRQGDLAKPNPSALLKEHCDAVRSVLIHEIRDNDGLIKEIVTAAEVGI